MRRRLRKWLGIAALTLKYVSLLKRLEVLESENQGLKTSVADLEKRLMELDGRLPARPKLAKPQPQQMTNWSEFLRTVEKGEEISA